MSLVSYGISDSSEDEDDQNVVHRSTSQPLTIHSSIIPPYNISFIERDLKHPVRILAPPLLQVDGEPPKKMVKPTIGCGLKTLLPVPKLLENASFRPFDKSKNFHENGVDSSLDSGQKYFKESSSSLPSFFLTPSTNEIEDESSFDHENEVTADNHMGYELYDGSTNADPDMKISDADTSCSAPPNGAHGIRRPTSSLNAEDLVKLCGSQGKYLTSKEIRLIEIDGSKLANSAELKTNNLKSLTYDYNALYRQHKFKSSQRERTKHQITYLVEHAKFFEREVTCHPRNSMISQKRYGF